MEDGVVDTESLVHPVNLSPRGGSRAIDDHKEESERKDREAKEGEERPGGFINHLLSNLVSGGEVEGEKVDEEDDEKKGGSAGGSKDDDKGSGLLSHLISNLVSPRSQKAGKVGAFEVENGGSKAEENVDGDGADGRPEKGGGGGGGGGIIESLVSHLPAPLKDDTAPTTDEASILIHSIIHD